MSHTSTWTSIEEEMPPARVEVIVMHESGEVRKNQYLSAMRGFFLENLYGRVIWWMPKSELPPRNMGATPEPSGAGPVGRGGAAK